MPTPRKCQTCGADLDEGASPQGLCPRCLLGAAVAKTSAADRPDSGPSGLVGRVIDGKYRIEKVLGGGGMGTVYLATHIGTSRAVALKVIAPHLMAQPEFVERFRREARASGRLRHPNIVNVTDFGIAAAGDGSVAYLVMEYLDGSSLAELLAKSPRPPLEWTIEILEQVCSAVDEAHRHGIIHRDLKPANIWLEPDRRGNYNVKVLDFGLATLRKASADEGAAPEAPAFDDAASTRPIVGDESATALHGPVASLGLEASTLIKPLAEGDDGSSRAVSANLCADLAASATLTRAGTVLGTPAYMSPEQSRGDRLDGRSDIYSLGVIAYQMLSGRLPFVGDTPALLVQHTSQQPELPRYHGVNIPERVEVAVMSALAKIPDSRPASASAFATTLRAGAEDKRAVIRQAFRLYTAHFPISVRLSPFIGTAPLALVVGLGWGSVVDFLGSTTWSPGQLAAFGMFVVLTLNCLWITSLLRSGAVVPLVACALESPLEPLSARGALPFAWRRAIANVPTLLDTQRTWVFMGFWFVALAALRYSPLLGLFIALCLFVSGAMQSRREGTKEVAKSRDLVAPAIIVEGLAGRAARARAVELAGRLTDAYGVNPTSIKVFSLGGLIRLLPFILISFAVFAARHINDEQQLTAGVMIAAGAIVLSTILGLLLNPLDGIIFALLYLKARRLGGETLKDIVEQLPVRAFAERQDDALRESGLYCPQCRAEYMPGVTECTDCGLPLVDGWELTPLIPERFYRRARWKED